MDIFEDIPLATVETMIVSLATQIASGAAQISSPDAGSVGYVSRSEAIRTLKALKRSKNRRLGLPPDPADQVRMISVVPRYEYWQR